MDWIQSFIKTIPDLPKSQADALEFTATMSKKLEGGLPFKDSISAAVDCLGKDIECLRQSVNIMRDIVLLYPDQIQDAMNATSNACQRQRLLRLSR